MNKEINVDEHSVKLTILDVGGQERFKFMRKNFYRGASGALLIFDLTRATTYEIVSRKWYPEMLNFVGSNIPFLLVGNKLDLVKDVGEVVDKNAAKEFAESKGSIYIETSAKTGENVEEAFIELTRTLHKKMS